MTLGYKEINPHVFLLFDQQSWIDYLDKFKRVKEHIGLPTSFPCIVTTFIGILEKGPTIQIQQAEHRFVYCNSIKELKDAEKLFHNRLMRIED